VWTHQFHDDDEFNLPNPFHLRQKIMTYNSSAHLNEADIAAYLDGAMTETERKGMEAHLSTCDECRLEVTDSHEAVNTAPRTAGRSRLPIRWIGLAAAAAVLVVAVSTFSRTTSNGTTERGTAVGFPGLQRVVAIVSPGDNSALGSDRRLVWRSEGSGATYRLTIGDDSGQPIHSASLSDTSFAIPGSVALTAGRKYFWYVDAITGDGTTATSGLNSFTIE
jgi:hypothetical protein